MVHGGTSRLLVRLESVCCDQKKRGASVDDTSGLLEKSLASASIRDGLVDTPVCTGGGCARNRNEINVSGDPISYGVSEMNSGDRRVTDLLLSTLPKESSPLLAPSSVVGW